MGFPSLRKSLFDISAHIAFTLIISLLLYAKSHNLIYVSVFVAGGVFVDLDHIIDHLLFFKNRVGKNLFNLSHFLRFRCIASEKVYVLFHSWELNFLIFLMGMFFQSPELLILCLSLTIHVAIDNVQRKNLLFYFLTYRMSKKFSVKILLPEYSSL